MPITSSHFSITSHIDNLSLTGHITSTHPRKQQYNPDNGSFSPNWNTTYNILTPKIFKLGTNGDILSDPNTTTTWYDVTTPGVESQIVVNADYSVQNFADGKLSTAATQGTKSIILASIPSGMAVGSVIKVGADTELKTITAISGTTVTIDKALATGTYAINTVVANPAPKCLIIKNNILTKTATYKHLMCSVTHYDPIANINLNNKILCTLNLISNGTGSSDAYMTTPNGTVFKNGGIASLKLHCDLLRDKTIGVPDNTNVTYKWYIQDKTVFEPTTLSVAGTTGANTITVTTVPANMRVGSAIKVGADSQTKTISAINGNVVTFASGATLASGTYAIGTSVINPFYQSTMGAGWKYLNSITGYDTNEITVTPSDVNGIGIFQCEIKDTDSASSTYNTYFYDTATVIDYTDPIVITVTSTGGNIFQNGVGSTNLTAKVFRGEEELDSAGSIYTYTWTKWDKNDTQIAFADSSMTKTGKTLYVGSQDVGAYVRFKVSI